MRAYQMLDYFQLNRAERDNKNEISFCSSPASQFRENSMFQGLRVIARVSRRVPLRIDGI